MEQKDEIKRVTDEILRLMEKNKEMSKASFVSVADQNFITLNNELSCLIKTEVKT